MGDSQISPYNLNDLKNTTDDALGNYVRGLNFKQDNSKLDIRLAVGYASVIIAGVLFAADYKLGWEATRAYTGIAVLVYALLNGFLTYWTWAVEKGLVFEGTRNGQKISLYSKTKKHDPTYYLSVESTRPGATPSTRAIRAPFTTWFTADGYFVAQPFQQWLASSVEAIGDADLKNAGRDERDELAAPSAEVHVLEQSTGDVSSTGADKGKGTKRGKKKA